MDRIIIIDDDAVFIDMLKTLLANDCEVTGATNSVEGIELVKNEDFDMVIVDYLIDSHNNGKDVVEKIREFKNDVYILMLTGCKNEAPGLHMLKNVDIQSYKVKDAENLQDLLISIKSALKSVEFTNRKKLKNSTSFPAKLKELRIMNGKSQEDLAKYLDIKRTQVSNYELSISKPSLEIAEKIADYFQVSLDYLLGRSNYPNLIKD